MFSKEPLLKELKRRREETDTRREKLIANILSTY